MARVAAAALCVLLAVSGVLLPLPITTQLAVSCDCHISACQRRVSSSCLFPSGPAAAHLLWLNGRVLCRSYSSETFLQQC